MAKAEEDAKIASAMKEAAKIDQQAKEMMAKAQAMMETAEQRAREAKQVKIVKEVVVKEVIPAGHAREKEQLQEMNATILGQRDRIGKELERTQEAMEAFVREKEELRAKLKKIESHILGGASSRNVQDSGDVEPSAIDSEVTLLRQQVEYRRAQIKLKEKAKKEARHEAERKAMAIEKQQMEEELKTAQETAQAVLVSAKKKESKYRSKVEAMRQEIADLNNEFERERENLLDTIREQTKESKLLEQLVELFLPQNELVKVWERAVWNDEREEWTLPKLKPRSDFQKLRLPTLAGGAGESGGAEVVSDEESSAPATVSGRSTASGSRQDRRNLIPRAPTSVHGGTSSKPSSSTEGSLITTRSFADGTMRSNGVAPGSVISGRVVPPENARLPGGVGTSRFDALTAPMSSTGRGTSPSNAGRQKKDKERDRPAGIDANTLPQAATGRFYDLQPDEDSVSPMVGDYQPRDRLQSRQGSRQGSRQERSRVPTSTSNGFDEFDGTPSIRSPQAATAPRNGGSSRSESRHHHRHHRERREAPQEDDEDAPSTVNGEPSGSTMLPSVENGNASPEGRTKSSKRDKKKRKERREKHGEGGGSSAPTAVDGSGGSGRHASGRHGAPSDGQDEQYEEDW